MVSLPAYDNNQFATSISADEYAVYLNDPAKPLRNHAIADIYPPGSTFKLVTGLAALEEGVTSAAPTVADLRLLPDPERAQGQCLFDWNHAGFGPLNMTQAYAVSSDTFFYQMAVGLGVDRLGKWANRLDSARNRESGCRARRRGSSPAESGRARRAARTSSPASWPRPALARTWWR